MVRELVIRSLHPARGLVTWACQRGWLPSGVRKLLPWRWSTEPFTIYGQGWKVRWFPTPTDMVAHSLFWGGLREWESETAPVIFENIRRAKCFFDIGANTGFYAVAGAVINPAVRVVAIEPVPANFMSLQRNVRENKVANRVTSLNVALADSCRVVDFHEAEDSSMSSLNSAGYQGQKGRVIQVECRTLDDVAESLGAKPDFLKIDVEGFESVVLSGGRMVLEKYRPGIVLEANPGDPCEKVSAILKEYGYKFRIITKSGLQERAEIIPENEFRNWFCASEQYA